MTVEPKIQINMLGGFSITMDGKCLSDQNSRSKKMWFLLEYLITFRDKDISQEELIDILWPDDSSDNPVNALKTLVYRARTALEELELPKNQKFIVQQSGSYAWNCELDFAVDADRFEQLCKSAAKATAPEKALEYNLQAIDIFKGSFLPKSLSESWVIPISAYYNTLYLEVVGNTINYLLEQERYQDIVDVCNKAIVVNPHEEDFYYYLIYALVKLGNTKDAKVQYKQVCDLFFSQFGVSPSLKLMNLYKEVVSEEQSAEIDLNIIKEELKEHERIDGAFFCEYGVFKDFYRLQARSMARTGQSIYLGLITLLDKDGDLPKLRLLNTAMTKVADCIQDALRKGDLYARYSVSQYIVMLPTTTYENACLAINRVVKKYKRENTRSQVELHCNVQPLEPVTYEFLAPDSGKQSR